MLLLVALPGLLSFLHHFAFLQAHDLSGLPQPEVAGIAGERCGG